MQLPYTPTPALLSLPLTTEVQQLPGTCCITLPLPTPHSWPQVGHGNSSPSKSQTVRQQGRSQWHILTPPM